MTNTSKILTLLLSSSLVLTGCSEKEPEVTQADVDAAAQKAAAEATAASDAKNESKLTAMEKSSKEQLASATAEMESKLEAETAKMQEHMRGQLAKQTADLRAEFSASNTELKNQYESLASKYNSLKSKLPENVTETVDAKLPELKSSIGNLESLTSNFAPESLEQLKNFQTKYKDELALAKNAADEILKLFGKGTLDSYMPKL